jgi:bla regulator protein BlaR1
VPDVPKWPGSGAIKRMRFNENGLIDTDMDSENLLLSALTWTNGFIISEADKTCAGYDIREIEGETYLFLQWKSGDYIYRNMDPWIYVFKKEANDE